MWLSVQFQNPDVALEPKSLPTPVIDHHVVDITITNHVITQRNGIFRDIEVSLITLELILKNACIILS